MWRLTGAVLLLGGGCWGGLRAAMELSCRTRALEAWLEALTLLEGELAFSLPEVPRLLEELSRRAASPAREVFAGALAALEEGEALSLSQAWTAALERAAGPLAPGDREVVARLGRFLGRYGVEDQLSALAALRRELEGRLACRRAQQGQKARAFLAAGFALGAFLTILLL